MRTKKGPAMTSLRRHIAQLYHPFSLRNCNLALECVTRDAQAVADWARNNGLTLNASKTKVMILGSDAYSREFDLETLPCVVINGNSLSYVTEARSLGVTFTNTLNWQTHARHVARKVSDSFYTKNTVGHALHEPVHPLYEMTCSSVVQGR